MFSFLCLRRVTETAYNPSAWDLWWQEWWLSRPTLSRTVSWWGFITGRKRPFAHKYRHLFPGRQALLLKCYCFFVNEAEIENWSWRAAVEYGKGYKSLSSPSSLPRSPPHPRVPTPPVKSARQAGGGQKTWAMVFLQHCQWIYPAIRHLQVACECRAAREKTGRLERWAVFTVAAGELLTGEVSRVPPEISLCQTCSPGGDGGLATRPWHPSLPPTSFNQSWGMIIDIWEGNRFRGPRQGFQTMQTYRPDISARCVSRHCHLGMSNRQNFKLENVLVFCKKLSTASYRNSTITVNAKRKTYVKPAGRHKLNMGVV